MFFPGLRPPHRDHFEEGLACVFTIFVQDSMASLRKMFVPLAYFLHVFLLLSDFCMFSFDSCLSGDLSPGKVGWNFVIGPQ